MGGKYHNHLRHRLDIDGLRAVAVLGVLIYHIDGTLVPGGFLGVDVFFVISGFLITSIIQRGLDAGNFSIIGFYERRIRRIIPALFAMMLLVSPVMVFLMSPVELKDYAMSVRAVVIITSNIHFLDYLKDYFNGDALVSPMLHTWSLSLEEQFYLVFPLLLILVRYYWKFKYGALTSAIVLTLLSIIACIVIGNGASMNAFYLLPYRAWELLAGALLALIKLPPPGRKSAQLAGGLGMLMVLGSFWAFNEENLIPGISAIPACFGTVLLLFSGKTHETFAARALSWKPLVGIGLISYSLYLWHWPLIVIFRYLFPEQPEISLPTGAAIFGLSLVFGALSWRWIEQPFRKPGTRPRKFVFLSWAGFASVILLLCAWCAREEGFPGRYSEKARYFLGFKTADPRFSVLARMGEPQRIPQYGYASAEPSIALWGDSHAAALLPALESLALKNKVSFRFYGAEAQVPVPGVSVISHQAKYRSDFTDMAFRQILDDERLATVVLHGRWSLVNQGKNDRSHVEITKLYQRGFSSTEELEAYYAGKIRDIIRRLRVAGKRVIVIYPVPEVGVDVPDLLATQDYRGIPLTSERKGVDFFARQAFVMGVFDSLPPDPMLLRIKPHERLMSGDRLKILEGGAPLYRDNDHLSVAGAAFIEDLLIPIFEEP